MFFEIPTDTIQDVKFDLIDLDRVPVGDPFSVVVTIHVIEYVQLFRHDWLLKLFLFGIL